MKRSGAAALTGILVGSGLALAEAAPVNVSVARTNAITVGTRGTDGAIPPISATATLTNP